MEPVEIAIQLYTMLQTTNMATRPGMSSVARRGHWLVMTAPRPGRVYSRWDLRAHQPGVYGMHVVAGLRERGLRSQDHVLALGLGGGVVQGDLLCHGWAASVLSIELDPKVIAAAQRHFFPAIFGDTRCAARRRQQMHVLLGDATNGTLLRSTRRLFGGVVADIGPVYLLPTGFPVAAWRGVLQQTACRGVLVCNTLFPQWADVGVLTRRLQDAGWSDTSVEPVSRPWEPGVNVLVYARRTCLSRSAE